MGNSSKKIFLSNADILFNDMSNKEIILSRIKEMPSYVISVKRRNTD